MAKTEVCVNNGNTESVPAFDLKVHARIGDYRGEDPMSMIKLYRDTYHIIGDDLQQRSYPYPEVLDPEWVVTTAQDERRTIWKVVTDTRDRQMIGAGMILLNRENQRGYIRGVLINPKYQGSGIGGYILVNTFQQIIDKSKELVKIFFVEGRTAHNKSVKMAEASGMKPVAVLPNKDYFEEKRESDVLLVLHAMNTLKNRRADPKLIPDVMAVFEVIRQAFKLEPVVAVPSPVIKEKPAEVTKSMTTDCYEYQYYTFCANGKELKFLLNPRTQTAENTAFPPDTDASTLNALLETVLRDLGSQLSYMECYVSAYRPEWQEVFVNHGFRPTGYIPGWDYVEQEEEQKDAEGNVVTDVEGKPVKVVKGWREDVIVMTWTKLPLPALADLTLTDKSKKIARLILR